MYSGRRKEKIEENKKAKKEEKNTENQDMEEEIQNQAYDEGSEESGSDNEKANPVERQEFHDFVYNNIFFEWFYRVGYPLR